MIDEQTAEAKPAEATATTEAPAAPATPAPAAEKTTRSIVPARYAGKYKSGGSDELAAFIKKECSGKEGFEFPAFFQLCRKNGLPEEKVAHYEGQVAAKRHGAEGRARMTLRNMLATIARKNGKLVGLNGEETAITLAKPVLSGAAADAKAASAANTAPSEQASGEAATGQF